MFQPSQTKRAPLRAFLDSQERTHLASALKAVSWNMTRAARQLGITRQGLYGKMKRLRIKRPRESRAGVNRR